MSRHAALALRAGLHLGNSGLVVGNGTLNLNALKGFADEMPQAHKEAVPTSQVINGNYKLGKNLTAS
jgi:hypothetical protein